MKLNQYYKSKITFSHRGGVTNTNQKKKKIM